MFEVWADPAFDRELRALPRPTAQAIEAALPGLRAAPLEHPQVVRLHGARHAASIRLRVGRARVIALVLQTQRVILLTTCFVKKRQSDYDQALLRHERRLRAQGPPLSGFIEKAKRR